MYAGGYSAPSPVLSWTLAFSETKAQPDGMALILREQVAYFYLGGI
jgi:hypothetical protein